MKTFIFVYTSMLNFKNISGIADEKSLQNWDHTSATKAIHQDAPFCQVDHNRLHMIKLVVELSNQSK